MHGKHLAIRCGISLGEVDKPGTPVDLRRVKSERLELIHGLPRDLLDGGIDDGLILVDKRPVSILGPQADLLEDLKAGLDGYTYLES